MLDTNELRTLLGEVLEAMKDNEAVGIVVAIGAVDYFIAKSDSGLRAKVAVAVAQGSEVLGALFLRRVADGVSARQQLFQKHKNDEDAKKRLQGVLDKLLTTPDAGKESEILNLEGVSRQRWSGSKGMAAMHEQPGPEAAYKKGDIIGGKYEVHACWAAVALGKCIWSTTANARVGLALKTFRQKFLADAEVRENFKREALLWVNLEEHPFILAARFVEELSGRLFVGMDYIAPDDRGRVTLADHLARAQGPLETDQALLWASMFCYGMEHANQRGIKSHRDIKPTNILIRQDGTLLISDFGLAAAAEAAWKGQGGSWESAGEEGFVGLSLFQTEGKRVCGTPGYLAPEVFRGEGADVRSDIYSFGLVLWQMAAGSQVPPFAVGVAPPRSPRDTDRYALEIYEQQMRKRAPAVGEPFEAVIERCLAPEPSKRFASFTQLRAELEPVLHRRTGQTVKLPPVGERSAVFWANKGLSLFSLGRLEEAVACFRKVWESIRTTPPRTTTSASRSGPRVIWTGPSPNGARRFASSRTTAQRAQQPRHRAP